MVTVICHGDSSVGIPDAVVKIDMDLDVGVNIDFITENLRTCFGEIYDAMHVEVYLTDAAYETAVMVGNAQ